MEKENGESKVKDLVDKLQKGETSPKEALKELGKRKLTEKTVWSTAWETAFGTVPWVIYFPLWLTLNIIFSARLLTIQVPIIVIYISAVLAVFAIILVVWAGYYHRKSGGLNHMETVLLFKKGPY